MFKIHGILGFCLALAVLFTGGAGSVDAQELLGGTEVCEAIGVGRFCLPYEVQNILQDTWVVSDDTDPLFSVNGEATAIILTMEESVPGFKLQETGIRLSGLTTTPGGTFIAPIEPEDIEFIGNWASFPVSLPVISGDQPYQVLEWITLAGADPISEAAIIINLTVDTSAAEPPVADFSFSPSAPVVDQEVQFTDRSVGVVKFWEWNWGDGTAPQDTQNPSHIFSEPGDSSVTLTVWDANGLADSETKTITILEVQQPDASFTYAPAAPVAGVDVVQFTDTSQGNPRSWEWDFDDGGDSTEQNPLHTFAEEGEYSVKLTVSNSEGSNDEVVLVTVHSATQPPEALFFHQPVKPTANEVVRFFGASGGGSADSWDWDFGDGGSSEDRFARHTFTSEGSFDVTLTVTNSAGSDSIERTIDVAAEVPPIDPDLDQITFVSSAARTGGVGDSFFVTDIDVNNAGAGMATYKVAWLPRDTDNSAPIVSDEATIEAGETVRISDVLGTVFGVPDGTDAVGAVAFASDSGDLKIFSRTYNSSDTGTFGQAIPGVASGDLIPAGVMKRILFFTENGGYRSNIGFLNGTGASISIKWRRYTADGTMVDEASVGLPAWGNTQFNKVFSAEAPVEGGYVDVWTDTEGAVFTAYGSVLDNGTSDPTTVLPD